MNNHSRWSLQDAKTQFDELLRKAGKEGPQHVGAPGKGEAIVLSAKDYARLCASAETGGKAGRTGQDLIDAMRDQRLPAGFDFKRTSRPAPVRKSERLFDAE